MGFLKLLPVFFMVLPGVFGFVLFKDIIGTDNNLTLPVLIQLLLPSGMIGIVTAGLLAALMSTIAGALNRSATLVAVDIVKRVWPKTKDQTQVLIGRIAAMGVMILAMMWSTQGGKFSSIFVTINKIPMIFAPAITCVFLWGVFWRRGTKEASLITLITGFVVGAVYFALDLPLVGDVSIITENWGIPFMQVGVWLFIFCSIVYVTVSLFPPGERINHPAGGSRHCETAFCCRDPEAERGRVQGLLHRHCPFCPGLPRRHESGHCCAVR